MLYLFGISICFFLNLLLLSKKNKTKADKILLLWLLTAGAHLVLYYMRMQASNPAYAFLLGVEIPFPLLHGPLLFLYTAAMTNQEPKGYKWLFHFIVPAVAFLSLVPFILLPGADKIMVYKNNGAGYGIHSFINLMAVYVSGIFYIIWSVLLLKKHTHNIENQFSDTDKINLNWLRYLVYGMAVIWAVVLIGNDELIFGTVVVFVLLLGFFGIKQVGIFSPANQQKLNTNGQQQPEMLPASNAVLEKSSFTEKNNVVTEEMYADTVKKKYSKSGLTNEQAALISKELNRLMEKEKLFTESELTLAELAGRLNIHPNYLSQVINEKEETNFYDYINTLRIEEYKKLVLMPENKKYTILTLAYECGFNSKSSFNRYFKKVTGVSPSEYMRYQAAEN